MFTTGRRSVPAASPGRAQAVISDTSESRGWSRPPCVTTFEESTPLSEHQHFAIADRQSGTSLCTQPYRCGFLATVGAFKAVPRAVRGLPGLPGYRTKKGL